MAASRPRPPWSSTYRSENHAAPVLGAAWRAKKVSFMTDPVRRRRTRSSWSGRRVGQPLYLFVDWIAHYFSKATQLQRKRQPTVTRVAHAEASIVPPSVRNRLASSSRSSQSRSMPTNAASLKRSSVPSSAAGRTAMSLGATEQQDRADAVLGEIHDLSQTGPGLDIEPAELPE